MAMAVTSSYRQLWVPLWNEHSNLSSRVAEWCRLLLGFRAKEALDLLPYHSGKAFQVDSLANLRQNYPQQGLMVLANSFILVICSIISRTLGWVAVDSKRAMLLCSIQLGSLCSLITKTHKRSNSTMICILLRSLSASLTVAFKFRQRRTSSPVLLVPAMSAQETEQVCSQRVSTQGRSSPPMFRLGLKQQQKPYVEGRRNLMVYAADNDQSNQSDLSSDQRLEKLEARLGVGRKSRREGGGVAEAPPVPKLRVQSKAWDDMSLAEKAWELYIGDKGALFWLNKLAYASIFVIIGGWIVFRFIGPALGWYELDSPLLPPSQVLAGTGGR